MKHRKKIWIAAAVYMLFTTCSILLYLPLGRFTAEDITRDAQGNIYATGKDYLGVSVYQMDAQGNAMARYKCRREAQEAETFCWYAQDALFVGQVWYEAGKTRFSVWRKSDSERQLFRVWEMTLEEDVNITDFQLADGVLCAIGVEQRTEDIFLYRQENGKNELTRFKNDFIPTIVCGGNGGLYTLSNDNHIYYITLDGEKSVVPISDAVLLITDENGIYYQKKGSADLSYSFYNGLGGYTYTDLGDIWNIQYSARVQNSAVLAFQDGTDKLLLISQDGTVRQSIDYFQLNMAGMIKEGLFPFIWATMIAALVLLIVGLFYQYIWKKRKLLYQTMGMLVFSSGIWLAAASAGMCIYETENEKADALFYADSCMNIQKGRLQDSAVTAGMNLGTYLGSEQQKLVEANLSDSIIQSTWQSFFTRTEIVCGLENPLFVFSEEAAFGRQADTYYDAEMLSCIKQCIRTGEDQHIIDKVNGISYAVAISPIGRQDRQFCILSRVPVRGVGSRRGRNVLFYISAFCGWIILMLLIRTFLMRKWQTTEVVAVQMEKISRGDYRIERRRVPDNEFGLMWTALERMCRNLQMQRYQHTQELEYVYQFAPRNFAQLFAKEKLQDVEVGEVIQLSATMGIISVIDKEVLLTGRLQREYVQYANQLMDILFSRYEASQAVFLQNGSNLENVKAVFQGEGGSVLTAVQYSIGCMEALLGQTGTRYDTRPFILLHTAQFSCGLAGGSKQVYPYVTSLELETLNQYVKDFKDNGVRIVVTEQTWTQVKGAVNGRYIGYVASFDEKDTFKLYELLDACPQAQKFGKMKNADKFAQALQQYYDNMIHLARNTFAEILKDCPEDGIARWYVFACEEYLNREDHSDAGHELFCKVF